MKIMSANTIQVAVEGGTLQEVDKSTQSEIYRGIFGNYGGTSGKIFDNHRGHYVGEVQILNV